METLLLLFAFIAAGLSVAALLTLVVVHTALKTFETFAKNRARKMANEFQRKTQQEKRK